MEWSLIGDTNYSMKKSFLFMLLTILFSFQVFPTSRENFSYAMQYLVRYTACLGKYNPAEANLTWEPANFYTEIMIAKDLAVESGKRTVTHTFYGLCFDYAHFALVDIESTPHFFESNGMKKNCFYMADTLDSNQVILSTIMKKNPDRTMNGVPLKNIKTMNVKTHKDSQGFRATNHAWIWVQRVDGVWFWLDPTWTDNLGYIVWGYVKDGEEIQLKPDRKFCVKYPSFLNSLPEAPEMQNNNFQRTQNKQIVDSTYRMEPNYFLYGFGGSASVSNIPPCGAVKLSLIGAIDWNSYVQLPCELEWSKQSDGRTAFGFIAGLEGGKQIVKFQNNSSIGLYALGSIGFCSEGFAYKYGGGLFIQKQKLMYTLDFSYSSVMEYAISAGLNFAYLGAPVYREVKGKR